MMMTPQSPRETTASSAQHHQSSSSPRSGMMNAMEALELEFEDSDEEGEEEEEEIHLLSSKGGAGGRSSNTSPRQHFRNGGNGGSINGGSMNGSRRSLRPMQGFRGGQRRPSSPTPGAAAGFWTTTHGGRNINNWSLRSWGRVGLLSLFGLLGLKWMRSTLLLRPAAGDLTSKFSYTDEDGILHFHCPDATTTTTTPMTAASASAGAAARNFDVHQEKWYNKQSRSLNVTEYLRVFRNVDYDNWGRSYTEVKKGMYDWKAKHFANLPDRANVYESACGIGMNLYMTLEIVRETEQQEEQQRRRRQGNDHDDDREQPPAKQIAVHGSDYSPESIRIAKAIFQKQLLQQAGGSGTTIGGGQQKNRLGTFCAADSTDLPFVPSDSFDAVFTGYISPLFDPLGLNGSSTRDNFARYVEFCEAANKSAAFVEEESATNDDNNGGGSGEKEKQQEELLLSQVAAAHRAQEIQNDWYATWVGEMFRIAKPGAPVMVEQVSWPLCDAVFDWGGVHPDFWTNATVHAVHGWDVDMDSVAIEKDVIFRKRYHVFMRKNKKGKQQQRQKRRQ